MVLELSLWKQSILECRSLKSTTKYLLLTLEVFMNSKGIVSLPVKDLAELTGLSERTICSHIEYVVTAGFIKKQLHGLKGQQWKRNEYVATISPFTGENGGSICL